MSSIVDPAKLKVAELRTELSARGLDTKGNKPVLVKRLKEALEEELKEEIPDTSILETSTEDLDSTQSEEDKLLEDDQMSAKEEPEPVPDEPVAQPEPAPEVPEQVEEKVDEEAAQVVNNDVAEKVVEEDETEEAAVTKVVEEEKEAPKVEDEEAKVTEEKTEEVVEETTEEKAEVVNEENGEQEDSKTRKSRWGSNDEKAEVVESAAVEQPAETAMETNEQDLEVPKVAEEEPVVAVQKGEKRRHSSPSPDRAQRRRSRSPIREDEPVIDSDKTQLSWYDSDLHLQLDKESFLSAKPLHEGAFGYAWAGVRATHGVSTGKVFYEVKITEELKWEDLSKHHDRNRREHRVYRKSTSEKSDHGKESDKKSEEKTPETTPAIEAKIEDEKMDDTPASEATEEKFADAEAAAETEKVAEIETEKPVEAELEKPVEAELEKSVEAEVEKPEESAEAEKPTEGEAEPKPVEAEPELAKPVDTEEKPAEEKVESMETETVSEKSAEEPEKVAEPFPSHLLRVGWSVIKSDLQLGEAPNSFGYESTGKFVTDKTFTDYALKFGKGDVIGAFLNIDEENVTITYSVNGEMQAVATTIPKPEEGFALFPHILSRNFALELNFGDKEAWFALPEGFDDYVFVDAVEEKVAGPVRPENRSDCEVILMCGLPGAGKTHWVNEHVASNLEKIYTVLGDDYLLDRMTIHGATLKSGFKGRWSSFMEKLQKSLTKLLDIACLRRRNFIIDQTNVFPSAQRRKLRPFEGFKRSAVVVVVGDEEYAKRQALQEGLDGKDVPQSSLLEMKANISIPQKGDWLDEVIFAGVEETEAKEIIQKYNTVGREAGFGAGNQRRPPRRDDRWQNRRNDHRGGGSGSSKTNNYRDRNYHNNRYDNRGPPRQGNWNQSWNRDRRDNRGPPMGGGGGGGGSRDWNRNRGSSGGGRSHDRGHRDSHNSRNQVGNYNRSRSGGRSQGNWQSNSNNWNSGQGWNSQGGYGGGGGGYGGGGQSWNQNQNNQWKYGGHGGSSGYGSYGSWNYYGQYGQNYPQKPFSK